MSYKTLAKQLMTEDEFWMSRCIQLARNGLYGAPPNPMVGAVIVFNGRVIGEGFHARCGSSHAEVNAFASVRSPELLLRSKMYVSLEPCAHYGKTPPCARLIIEKGVPEVVVGCVDPFAKVSGAGIRMLREAGVKVTVGILEKECQDLNRKFIVCQTHSRPFVTLKWAQSSDGFLAPLHRSGSSIFFSSPETLVRVQQLRASYQAIIVGRRTAQLDNPSLTLRLWKGSSPLRVVIDRHGILCPELHLFDGSVPTMVVGEKDNPARRGAHYEFLPLDFSHDILPPLLQELKNRAVQSLLVEGGAQLLQSFICQSLWDEAHVEISPVQLFSGLLAPHFPESQDRSEESFFGHRILHFRNR